MTLNFKVATKVLLGSWLFQNVALRILLQCFTYCLLLGEATGGCFTGEPLLLGPSGEKVLLKKDTI